MKIECDEDGRRMINTVCDAALKGHGLAMLRQVNTVLLAAEQKPEKKVPKPKKDED